MAFRACSTSGPGMGAPAHRKVRSVGTAWPVSVTVRARSVRKGVEAIVKLQPCSRISAATSSAPPMAIDSMASSVAGLIVANGVPIAVDALIERVIFARDRADLVAATRALDRVLLWNFYVVPQWTYGKERTARWDRFSRPALMPTYGASDFPSIWWWDADKAAKAAKRS